MHRATLNARICSKYVKSYRNLYVLRCRSMSCYVTDTNQLSYNAGTLIVFVDNRGSLL